MRYIIVFLIFVAVLQDFAATGQYILFIAMCLNFTATLKLSHFSKQAHHIHIFLFSLESNHFKIFEVQLLWSNLTLKSRNFNFMVRKKSRLRICTGPCDRISVLTIFWSRGPRVEFTIAFMRLQLLHKSLQFQTKQSIWKIV